MSLAELHPNLDGYCRFARIGDGSYKCEACGHVANKATTLPIFRKCRTAPAAHTVQPKTQPRLLCSLEKISDTNDCRCTRCGEIYRDAKPEELRVGCAKEGLGQPPAFHRLLNFGKALGKHWIDVAAKRLAGDPEAAYRTNEEIEAILAKCAKCPLFNGTVCTHVNCGCPITAQRKWFSKLAWTSEHCPKEPPEW